MDCGTARDSVQSQWMDVMTVWLDANASAVEQKSIKPLIQLLEEGCQLNERAQADAQSWLEKARAL